MHSDRRRLLASSARQLGAGDSKSGTAWPRLALVLAALACLGTAAPRDLLDQRRQRIERMNPKQKEQLRKRLERFESFSPEEQQRMRDLEAALRADPQAGALQESLRRYDQWLLDLPSSDRHLLLSLDQSKRLEQIKQLRGERLEARDRKVFVAWVLETASEILPRHESESVPGEPREERERRILTEVGNLNWQRLKDRKPNILSAWIASNPADLARLTDTLSKWPRLRLEQVLRSTKPEDQSHLFNHWMWQTYPHRWRGGGLFRSNQAEVSDATLKKFLNEVPASERARLVTMPRDALRGRLERMYHEKRTKSGQQREGNRSPAD